MTMKRKVTDKTIKALGILSKGGLYLKGNGLDARDFAEQMWPDSVMHSKRSNQGNGACKGKAAWLCAGSYIGKLQKQGLVHVHYCPTRYYITNKGLEILSQYSIPS